MVTSIFFNTVSITKGRKSTSASRSLDLKLGWEKWSTVWHEIFADWRFFVFCGNYFLQLGQIGFSRCELIFCDFQKVPSTQN